MQGNPASSELYCLLEVHHREEEMDPNGLCCSPGMDGIYLKVDKPGKRVLCLLV